MASLESNQDDWLIQMMSSLDINASSTRNIRDKVEQALTADSSNVRVRAVRQPKVVRVTSGPKQHILDHQNEDIKSQLAILLEILDEEYASYLIPKASFVDTHLVAVKTNNDTRLEEVKFAIRAAFSGKRNESQVIDKVKSWTYEDELKEASYLISKWKFVFQGQCV